MKRSIFLRKKRIVVLLSTLGMACASAQDRGRMIDHSQVLAQPMPPSSEREAGFAALTPSNLTVRERQLMLEAVAPASAPVQTVTLRDTLDGANFDSGRAELLPRARATLDALVARVAGKAKLRFRVVGHTDNQRIAARLKPVYPDNAALSQARALAVAGYLKERLNLAADAFAVSGRADTEPVADNRTPDGMAKNRRTEIEVWFEEARAGQAGEGAQPATLQVERQVNRDACAPAPGAAQPFSISVDGKPLGADSDQTEADRQRCVDVAFEQADVQVKYDPMNASPALNVWTREGAAVRGRALTFGSYTNYAFWLRRAEVRVFATGQDTRSTPLAVLPLPVGGEIAWTVPTEAPDQLVYLLRVFDVNGRFDETRARPLVVGDREPIQAQPQAQPNSGWGENTLALHNIPAAGGTVTVSGQAGPGQHAVAFGMPIPMDAKGRFALRQMLPAGPHTVQVALLDAHGAGPTFGRNLSIAERDWFYVAVADLTAGRDSTSGPARLVTGDEQHYDSSSWIDGRAAFYLKGKIKGEYLLTASADTREQPLRDLFSNFAAKDPNYLLRRIDPDRFYPVYGDDSTIVDDAPTAGKLYVRLARPDNGASVMWGNFQTGWTGTELTQ
ncbi:MAG: OmpA family protein, partial [Gammaproteobacteria bacterium]